MGACLTDCQHSQSATSTPGRQRSAGLPEEAELSMPAAARGRGLAREGAARARAGRAAHASRAERTYEYPSREWVTKGLQLQIKGSNPTWELGRRFNYAFFDEGTIHYRVPRPAHGRSLGSARSQW